VQVVLLELLLQWELLEIHHHLQEQQLVFLVLVAVAVHLLALLV
jgi:hypothetical protein